MKELTKRQQEVLKAVAKLHDELSRPATVTEIAARIGISRQNTRTHIWNLRERGYLNFKAQDRQALTPVLTAKAETLLGGQGYAVVGSIAAGQPLHAAEHLEGYTQRLSDLLPMHEGDFLLRVDGDSMLGAGYQPGDFVIVEPKKQVLNGEIAVAFLPDEDTATLKRYYRQGNTALLLAENPADPPLRLPIEQVDIQGVVIGHIGQRRTRQPLPDAIRDTLEQQDD